MSETETIRQIVREVVAESHQSVAKVQSNQYAEIDKKLDNLNGFGRLYKLMRSDLGLLMAILVFLVSILTPYYLTQIRLAVIDEKISNLIKGISSIGTQFEAHIKDNQAYHSDLNTRVSNIEGQLRAIGFLKDKKIQ